MRNKSWEIVVAGLLFIGVSLYVLNSQKERSAIKNHASDADSVKIDITDEGVRVITLNKLANLKNLEQLKELQNLKELKNLETLANLKALANYMPAEVKKDFIIEIEKAIKDLEHKKVDVQINIDDGIVSVEKLKDLKTGTWSFISPGVFAYVSEFNASDIKSTSLTIPFGSIKIVGIDNEKAKLVIQASGKVDSKKELESKLNSVIQINNNSANFNFSAHSNEANENIHLQATLNIPSSMSVKMLTKGGHIESTNIQGTQVYKTNGGHISLKQLSGNVEALTSGGHISLAGSNGKFILKTDGGHISAIDSEGEFILKTAGGNIEAQAVKGAINAGTGGGNIDLQIISLSGDLIAQTGAGSIQMVLPANLNANLNATGNTVELAPTFKFTGTNSAGTAEGRLGSGGKTIDLKTGYGKIVLKSN